MYHTWRIYLKLELSSGYQTVHFDYESEWLLEHFFRTYPVVNIWIV